MAPTALQCDSGLDSALMETNYNACFRAMNGVIPMSKIRSAYDGERKPVRLAFTGPGRTKQSFRDECDINNIMGKFQRTGLLEAVNKNQPRYGDVPAMDFRQAVENIRLADEMFSEMPSNVRKRFENDPGAFLAFIQNADNYDEAVELGLIVPPAPEEPVEVRVVPDPAPAAPAADAPAPG